MQKAANTDEAEKNEPDLDIPAELERRQARLVAIVAAKARLEVRQRQSDTLRGRSPDDERQPKDKDGKPKGGKPYQRDFGAPAAKAHPWVHALLRHQQARPISGHTLDCEEANASDTRIHPGIVDATTA